MVDLITRLFSKNEPVGYPVTGTKLKSSMKVIERYPLYAPFSYAVIAQDPATSTNVYSLDEISLSATEAAVYTHLLRTLENELTAPREKVDPKQYFDSQANKILSKYSLKVPVESWSRILYFAERDIVGFGLLDGLMRDQYIEDISVDGVQNPVFVYHRKYDRMATNIGFTQEEEVNDIISRFAHLAGKHVSVAFPITQGTLPGGHRLMATFRREVSPRGGTMSIRKFRADPITIIDMLNLGVLDHRLAAYIWLLMENRSTAIVVGSTGAGKTTLLNAMLSMTRTNTKIITIEEVGEINLSHPNWTTLLSRESYGVAEEGPKGVGLFDLVKAAMRMRPDVLVVGEIRGEEAYVLFQAISTGHGGLCTLHADDAASAMQRLVSRPMDVPPAFIPFLQLAFTVRSVTLPNPDGTYRNARRIVSVDEVSGVGDYTRMFTWDAVRDRQIPTPFAKSPRLTKLAADKGISLRDIENEIERRALVLRWIQAKNIRNFKELTPLFEAYINSPADIYEASKAELEAYEEVRGKELATPPEVADSRERPGR